MRWRLSVLAILSTFNLGCDSPPSQTTTSTVNPAPAVPPVPPPPPGAQSSTASPAAASAESTELTASEKRAGFSMKTYRGKQPVLLVFNRAEDEHYQKFSAALSQQQAEIDRLGLVVIEVFGTDRAFPNGRIRGAGSLSEEAATNLMDGYTGGGGTFKLVLVGKDGQVIERMGYKEPAEVLAKLENGATEAP